MKNIDKEKIDALCYFIFNSIVIKYSDIDEFPNNLKFVFNSDDIKLFDHLVHNELSNNYSFYLYEEDIDRVLSILHSNLDEYLYNRDDSINYIYVDDIVKFTNLIYSLNESIDNILYEDYSEFKYKILNSVWLRMSPNDYNNIYKFLEKQIKFCNSDYLNIQGLGLDNRVSYALNISSSSWFETNVKASICIYDDCGKKLLLPEIYFGLIDEDNKKVCYVYAVQNNKSRYSDDSVEDSLKDTKKLLRNKYVNYKFPLALHLFIELLKNNDIYDIKVPLLQIFNYDYHISISEVYKDRIKRLNESVNNGRLTYDSYQYSEIKKIADNVIDKADIISKNKTERLVNSFMLLEDRFNDIEILTEPFINDENLVVKVLKRNG